MLMKRISYDTSVHNFKDVLQKEFCVDSLCSIQSSETVFSRENDQSTEFHKKYYELARTETFQKLYSNFLNEVIQPEYIDTIIYQAIPNFRISFPNNVAVWEFHKDKNYRNVAWAEDVNEDNYFLPLNKAFGTNTIWVESIENKWDYAPMEWEYWETIKWDGSNLMHWNKINTTWKTRISLDFRIIQKKNYKESDYTSINTETAFKIWWYYNEL